MTGGEISGNTASNNGGGLYISYGRNFSKIGGTIFGSTGNINANRASNGHAVSGYNFFRNSTAGTNIRLDSNRTGAAGGWEN